MEDEPHRIAEASLWLGCSDIVYNRLSIKYKADLTESAIAPAHAP